LWTSNRPTINDDRIRALHFVHRFDSQTVPTVATLPQLILGLVSSWIWRMN
jgi:hypothetical protein